MPAPGPASHGLEIARIIVFRNDQPAHSLASDREPAQPQSARTCPAGPRRPGTGRAGRQLCAGRERAAAARRCSDREAVRQELRAQRSRPGPDTHRRPAPRCRAWSAGWANCRVAWTHLEAVGKRVSKAARLAPDALRFRRPARRAAAPSSPSRWWISWPSWTACRGRSTDAQRSSAVLDRVIGAGIIERGAAAGLAGAGRAAVVVLRQPQRPVQRSAGISHRHRFSRPARARRSTPWRPAW